MSTLPKSMNLLDVLTPRVNPMQTFVDIRFDTVLQARFDLKKGTEVLTKYSFR